MGTVLKGGDGSDMGKHWAKVEEYHGAGMQVRNFHSHGAVDSLDSIIRRHVALDTNISTPWLHTQQNHRSKREDRSGSSTNLVLIMCTIYSGRNLPATTSTTSPILSE